MLPAIRHLRRWLSASMVAAGFSVSAAEGPQPFDLEQHLRGERIYDRQCALCHGRNGRGDGEWGAAVATKPRDFTKGIFKFRTTPPGKLPTEADLLRTLRHGVSGTMMPTFAKLTPLELRSVIAYIRSFSKRWEDPRNYADPVALPATPDWIHEGPAAAAAARRGAVTFAQTCAACHGPRGKGDGPAAPGLRDVWDRPITPANLAQPHHKSGDLPADLFRTIALGLDGTPMAGFLAALGPERIWEVIAHLRTLEQEPPAEPKRG